MKGWASLEGLHCRGQVVQQRPCEEVGILRREPPTGPVDRQQVCCTLEVCACAPRVCHLPEGWVTRAMAPVRLRFFRHVSRAHTALPKLSKKSALAFVCPCLSKAALLLAHSSRGSGDASLPRAKPYLERRLPDLAFGGRALLISHELLRALLAASHVCGVGRRAQPAPPLEMHCMWVCECACFLE